MFRKAFVVWMLIVLLMGMTVVAGSEGISQVQISFDYNHMATIASNQFALWVEDNERNLIKTIYVTGFTGTRRGYRNREMSLPHWVKAADPEHMTDDAMDAVSGATPKQGTLTYIWDLTDDRNNRVSNGVYHVFLEASLYWESNILISAEVDLSNPEPGVLNLTEERSHPEQMDNEDISA